MNFDQTKEERLDRQTSVPNVDITNKYSDPDRSGTEMMDPKPKEDSCAGKEEIEGSCCSSDKKEETAGLLPVPGTVGITSNDLRIVFGDINVPA